MQKQRSFDDFDFDAFGRMTIAEREKWLDGLRQEEKQANDPDHDFYAFDFGPLIFRAIDVVRD